MKGLRLMIFSSPTIIISSYEYQSVLYHFKNSHPELDLKIINKEEVFNQLSFSFKRDPIPFLLSLGISYSKAKKYIDILRKANDFSIDEKLSNLYSQLFDKGYISFDDYGLLMFKDKDIFIFEADEDIELKNILSKKGLKYSLLHFEDLDFQANEFKNNDSEVIGPVVFKFDSKYEQFFYIFSDIRKKIINNPDIKNDIHILIEPGDGFYLQLIGDILGIENLIIYRTNISSNTAVSQKIKNIYKNRAFSFNDDELKNEYLKVIYDVIKKYQLDELPFDFAYSNLMDIISSTTYLNYVSDKGITSGDKFVIQPNKYTYITNFKHDSFYKEYDDNNVLDDQKLLNIGINPSYNKTLLDRRLKLNYLKYSNIISISFTDRHLQDSIYNSQFLDDKTLKWKNNIIHKSLNEEGLYTEEAGKIFLCDQFDKDFNDQVEGDINSYSHDYIKVDASKTFSSNKYSITDLERYFECPFAYYLNKLIPIDDDDYLNRLKGKLLHSVMEDIYNEDFNYEVTFEKSLRQLENYAKKNNIILDKKTYAFIEVIHDWMKQLMPIYKEAIHNMNYISPLGKKGGSEVHISTEIEESQNNIYTFNCYIDRILFTQYENKNYYTIIDYKTGLEEFDLDLIFVGKSLQLPFYYSAIEAAFDKSEYVGDAEFGGVGIFHNYANSINKLCTKDGELSKKSIQNYSCLSGVFLSSDEYANSIDRTSFTKKGTPCKGEFINRNKILFSSVDDEKGRILDLVPPERFNFNDLADLTRDIALEIIMQINDNNFVIAPSSLNKKKFDIDRLACGKCKYKDICYRNPIKDACDTYSQVKINWQVHLIVKQQQLKDKAKEEEVLDA